MSDTRPSSPSIDMGPGLSPEEVAERELRRMMSSPPPSFTPDDDEVDELALAQDAPTASLALPLTSTAGLLLVARRKAAQHKLHPYQRDAAEEFVKVIYYFHSHSIIC